jgi:hypothetical protein
MPPPTVLAEGRNVDAISGVKLIANLVDSVSYPGLLEGMNGSIFIVAGIFARFPVFQHRVLKAHFVGHEHHRRTPFKAHADQFSTGAWTSCKGKLSCGIEGRLNDYSLAGLEPIHSAGQFYHSADGCSNPVLICIFRNCCRAGH